MTTPADSRGRRANGLPATDWGALVDLDPRLSDGLLDRLAEAGVAAYVEPATAVDTVHRGVTMPVRPLDRLWVDPSRADSARDVVASEVADLTALLAEDDPGATAHGLVHPVPRSAARRVLPPPPLPGPPTGAPADGPATPGAATGGPATGTPEPGSPPAEPAAAPPPSDDDVFAELVAHFHDAAPGGGWPSAEDLPAPPADRAPPAGPIPGGYRLPPPLRPPLTPLTPLPPGPQPGPAPPTRRRTDPPPAGQQPPGHPPPVEPVDLDPFYGEDHFVPPPPPPVPRLRPRTLASVVAVALGLLVLFAPQVLRLPATFAVGVLGLALLAGGAAALIWSMRDSRDDDPGDGAVV